MLESFGIAYALADDGRAGLEAVMTGGFDAVLMDIQMPLMDGLEATRLVRRWEAEKGRPRTPIYMVSANCLREHIDAGAAAGADGHIAKPIAPVKLLEALQQAADIRGVTEASEALRFG